MYTHTIGRPAARALAVVLLASGAAIGLAACQTPPAPAAVEEIVSRPLDRMLIEKYGGRPVDRVAEDIERAIGDGQLPSQGCISHHVVEHPQGGYHLVCLQAGE
jgi:hypothetical protein